MDAVVLAPDIIRIQLGVCVSQIVKHDFPERWPQARHCYEALNHSCSLHFYPPCNQHILLMLLPVNLLTLVNSCLQVVDKVSMYLQNPDPTGWLGALLSLYQLVNNAAHLHPLCYHLHISLTTYFR